MGQYTDLLKNSGSSNIAVATPKGANLKKTQENRCARCKKDLRPGYYKFIKNESTRQEEIVCSDCLVHIAER